MSEKHSCLAYCLVLGILASRASWEFLFFGVYLLLTGVEYQIWEPNFGTKDILWRHLAGKEGGDCKMILQVVWKSLATISTCWWRQRGIFQEFLTCLVVVLCGLCRRIAQRNPSQRCMDRFCCHLPHCGKSEHPLGRHQNLLWKIALLPQPTADLRHRTNDFGFFSFTDVLPLNCADFVEIVCRLCAIA